MPGKLTSKYALQQEIGMQISQIMQTKGITSKQVAAALSGQFGLELASMATYLSHLIRGWLNGSGSTCRDPELVRQRLAAIVRYVGIEPDSLLVGKIREWDEQFDYHAAGHVSRRQPSSDTAPRRLEQIVAASPTSPPSREEPTYPPQTDTHQASIPVAHVPASQNGAKVYAVDPETGEVPIEAFQKGDMIAHSKWGLGTVVSGLNEANEAERLHTVGIRLVTPFSVYAFSVKFDKPPEGYVGKLVGRNTLRLGARRPSSV